MTQAALAERARVSTNYVSVVERGQKLPTLDTLVRMAKAVGASPAELLGDGRPSDEWVEELVAIGRTLPPSVRPMALAVLRAMATTRR